jgi:hypothetical protein
MSSLKVPCHQHLQMVRKTHNWTTDFVLMQLLKGIAGLAPSGSEFFSYYDVENLGSIQTAVDDLSDYVRSEGPFDGVIAFSQGAALAAMLLARGQFPLPFRFAVFICAGTPVSERLLHENVICYMDAAIDGPVLELPAVHIVGLKDGSLDASLALAELCGSKDRTIYQHAAGHEIPINESKQMARCIHDVITKASFAQ